MSCGLSVALLGKAIHGVPPLPRQGVLAAKALSQSVVVVGVEVEPHSLVLGEQGRDQPKNCLLVLDPLKFFLHEFLRRCCIDAMLGEPTTPTMLEEDLPLDDWRCWWCR